MKRNLTSSLVLALMLLASLLCDAALGQPVAPQSTTPPPPPLVTSSPTPPGVSEQPPADVSIFYDGLAPYGEWLKVDQYGWIWRPSGVSVDWRPYTTGHWAFTNEYGWMWVADEPWGWAPFHYGRWYWQDGWCWVPGSVWGPAWVDWREGSGCIGWCPLPPAVGWRAGFGLEFGDVRLDVFERVHPCWSFVDERFITEPVLREHIIVAARNTTLIERTKQITRIREDNGRIINESLNVSRIERITGRSVERVHVREVETVHDLRTVHPGDTEVTVFRKRISENERITPRSEAINRNLNAEEIEHRQERELTDLRTRQEIERRSLEEHQRREMTSPPDGVTVDDLRNQHDVERRIQQEQHQREIEVQKRWHERERERTHSRR